MSEKHRELVLQECRKFMIKSEQEQMRQLTELAFALPNRTVPIVHLFWVLAISWKWNDYCESGLSLPKPFCRGLSWNLPSTRRSGNS